MDARWGDRCGASEENVVQGVSKDLSRLHTWVSAVKILSHCDNQAVAGI